MDYTISSSVFVTFQFVGFHNWPDAYAEVSYLRERHRHLFKVRVDISVEHADRAIEYHMLQRAIRRNILQTIGPVFTDSEYELGQRSCESIAQSILVGLRLYYADQLYYRVEVSEDGENGSVVEARQA